VPPPTLAVLPSPAKPTPKVLAVVRQRKGRSIADKLKEFRAVQGACTPVKDVSYSDIRPGVPVLPEHLLLRDTLYLLQGISGKYVQFSRESEDKNSVIFVGDPVSHYLLQAHSVSSVQRYRILEPTKTLIHQLAEVGHLYIRVDSFVREKEGKSGVGMIEQSLCHHLQTQLTEYYRLIAVLESQMGVSERTDDSFNPPGSTPTDDLAEEETGLTLKRLDVWIDDWRLRMRMMSVCVEGAKGIATCDTRVHKTHGFSVGACGGALVSIIHSYTNNGDPFVRKFTDQLLEEVCGLSIRKQTTSSDHV